MKERQKPFENGQAIVLIAFAFVALVGMAALAIDGGMVYSDRRHAQNAADAGALAGAGAAALSLENSHVFYADFTCGTSNVNAAIAEAETAAENLMLANGYADSVISVAVTCQDDDGTYFDEKFLDITTHITRTTQTSLIHLVYTGDVVQNIDATTRVEPRMPLAFGHAIVALNDQDSCNNNSKEGVVFSGGGRTHIDGGGVWSNGCLKGVNNSCQVDVDNGDIKFAGGRFPTGTSAICPQDPPDANDPDIIPGFVNETLPQDSYQMPVPNCSHPNAVTLSSISSSINFDTAYPGKKLICLTSSGNALRLTSSNSSLVGHGITIYLVNGGDFEVNGGSVSLSAPGATPDPTPGLPGVLIYVNPVRNSVVKLNGNADTEYLGVIYAPRADVSINGTQDTYPTFNTQIIAWNVEVSGNATLDINYNDTWSHSRPTAIDLQE